MAGSLVPAAETHPDAGLRVCLYSGAGRLMERSGVGSAMRHQAKMLLNLGSQLVKLWKRPDIVQLNTIFPDSVLVGVLARALGIPVVVFAHSTREDFEQSWVGARTFAPLFEKWLGVVYRRGDVVVTPTPYSRGIIENYRITAPIRVLTNGVDTRFFSGGAEARTRFRARHRIASDRHVVLSVGHLMVRKGILEYIDLARSMPEADFYWAGTAPNAAMTPDVRAALAHPPSNLHLLGHIPPDEVRDAYAGADLFCFMSHEETQGIVVLEALSSGVPVLVRDIPVYDGWLHEVAVHRASTTREFETTARAVLSGEAPDLTEAGRLLAAQHDLLEVSTDLAAVHRDLLERRPGHRRAIGA
ncbi:glycosyltransferase [Tessaracoccus sp. Y36]|uniref:glycosyltransferase n=1 Tax=Tessaracoccus sp. ZS01 TaxID=1906324 RepID=UPI0009F980C6|nr:glycosyltransferase [Tessaracoccus sp. ZS01]MCG6567456.1 glycosyl transferase family 1 [Tessaracoccus sp. ZS01]